MKKYVKSSQTEYELELNDIDIDDARDKLIMSGVSEEAIDLITNINGYSIDTLNDVCRCRFGEGLDDFMMEFN